MWKKKKRFCRTIRINLLWRYIRKTLNNTFIDGWLKEKMWTIFSTTFYQPLGLLNYVLTWWKQTIALWVLNYKKKWFCSGCLEILHNELLKIVVNRTLQQDYVVIFLFEEHFLRRFYRAGFTCSYTQKSRTRPHSNSTITIDMYCTSIYKMNGSIFHIRTVVWNFRSTYLYLSLIHISEPTRPY